MKKFKIRYCRKCVIPNTRPDINFDKWGVCSACNNHFATKKKNKLEKKIKKFENNFKQT